MSEPLRPLPEHVQRLLDSQAPVEPPAGAEDRVWSRLSPHLGTLAASGSGAASPVMAAKLMGAWGLPVAVGALVLGLVGGVVVDRTLMAESAPRSVPSNLGAFPAAPQPEPTLAQPGPPAPPVGERATPEPVGSAKSPAPLAGVAKVAPPPGKGGLRARVPPPLPAETRADDATLAEESKSLETIRAALSRGAGSEALALLERHQHRFPNGRLMEEREILAVLALKANGQLTQAQRRADQFHRNFPDSLLRSVVESALQPSPSP